MVNCIDYNCDNKFESKRYFNGCYFVIIDFIYYDSIVFGEDKDECIDYFGY